MATVSRPASDSLAVAEWAADGDAESKSERYLAKRLAAAGAGVKGGALTTFLLAAGVGGMRWLAVGVIAENVVVTGGLHGWVAQQAALRRPQALASPLQLHQQLRFPQLWASGCAHHWGLGCPTAWPHCQPRCPPLRSSPRPALAALPVLPLLRLPRPVHRACLL